MKTVHKAYNPKPRHAPQSSETEVQHGLVQKAGPIRRSALLIWPLAAQTEGTNQQLACQQGGLDQYYSSFQHPRLKSQPRQGGQQSGPTAQKLARQALTFATKMQ